MSTEKPIITKAVVELTFANGITKRIILDDKDVPIEFDINTSTDLRETTADDASSRTFAPGPRRMADVHLVGRGPLQIDIPPTGRCGAFSVGAPDVRCDSVLGHPNLTVGSWVFNHGNIKAGSYWNDTPGVMPSEPAAVPAVTADGSDQEAAKEN